MLQWRFKSFMRAAPARIEMRPLSEPKILLLISPHNLPSARSNEESNIAEFLRPLRDVGTSGSRQLLTDRSRDNVDVKAPSKLLVSGDIFFGIDAGVFETWLFGMPAREMVLWEDSEVAASSGRGSDVT